MTPVVPSLIVTGGDRGLSISGVGDIGGPPVGTGRLTDVQETTTRKIKIITMKLKKPITPDLPIKFTSTFSVPAISPPVGMLLPY